MSASLSVFALAAGAFVLAGLGIVWRKPGYVIDRPRTVLAMLGAVSLAAVVMLMRIAPLGFSIDIDPASEPLIGRSDPGVPTYRAAVRDFGNDDLYVIAMYAEEGVFTERNLEVVERLTEKIERLPRIAEVESIATALSVRYDGRRELVEVATLMDGVPDSAEGIAELRDRVLSDPVNRKTLISDDTRTTAINITFQPMTDGEFVDLDLDGRIEAVLAREAGAGRSFYVAGRPHVRSKAYHQMVRDLAVLVPVAVLVAATTLWLMSGSIRAVLLPLLSCLTATLWMFGAMGALGLDLNLITLVVGPMMICVGSVYGVHVFARYQVIAGQAGPERNPALECLRYSRTPVLIAGFTTCIGFGALLLTDTPATNELGGFSIVGVAAVTLISLLGIPAALVLFPGRTVIGAGPAVGGGTRFSAWFGKVIDRALAGVADTAIERPRAVLVLWSALTAAALAALPYTVIDTDMISFFVEDSPVRTDFTAVNERLTGSVPIYVTVSGSEGGTFREPATLHAVERLQQSLENLPGVSEVLSSVDLIRRAHRAMMDDDPEYDRIPASRAGVAEATFILPKAKLRRFTNSDHSRGNLIVRTGNAGSAAVRSLERDIREVLGRTSWPPEFTTDVTGNAILINRSSDGIAGNQATQVGFAAGTIFLLICINFRSLRLAAISMVPNIVPVLLFFGALGLGVAPLSLPTSLIGSIAMGIAIDDTMHFLVAYRARRGAGASAEGAVRECILQVGRPIVMTSVMLVAGFLVILTAGFATLQEFGYLTAFTMALCLATDLILLPALLVLLRP